MQMIEKSWQGIGFVLWLQADRILAFGVLLGALVLAGWAATL